MRRIGIGVTTLTLLASFAAAQAAERERVCLNGVWQFSPGQIDQEALAADATFYDVPVPSFWDRMEEFGVAPSWPKELARGWYRRAFSVDRAWQGRRVLLTFDAVRYVAEVFVNGKSMGTHIDGFAPLVLDVTDAVRFDGSNDLLVKVTNWKGLLYPDAKDMEFPLFKDIRYAFAFFAPFGLPPRVGNQAGIWQDVWLEAVPVRRIERVKIETSVKDRLLTVRTWTAGEKAEGSRVRHEVLDGEKVVLTAEGAAPGAVEAKWAEAKLWWPHDPHLYHLRTQLLDGAGQVIDEITTRFGFREIGIDGKHVYFNGERLNLRADNYVQIMDAAGMLAMRKEYAKMLFELMKRCNINAVRLHGNPSPPSTLDAADEVGMLILNESATYGSESHMRVEDPLFQKNNLRHLEAWIQRDWNHPSVIAWSLANEFSAPVEHFRAMHELAKRLDPTRIAYNDGDFADVWCGHYTWDWTRTPQLPNTAYWFGDEEWVKRTLGKSLDEICIPHFVDEFYNVDTTARSLSPSVFFGPDVDKVPHQAKRDLHFHALRYVAEGARYTDLAEINPFCLIAHFWSFCVSGATLSWPDPTGSVRAGIVTGVAGPDGAGRQADASGGDDGESTPGGRPAAVQLEREQRGRAVRVQPDVRLHASVRPHVLVGRDGRPADHVLQRRPASAGQGGSMVGDGGRQGDCQGRARGWIEDRFSRRVRRGVHASGGGCADRRRAEAGGGRGGRAGV